MNTLGELVSTVGGTLRPAKAAGGDAGLMPVGRVVTDSRQVQPGDVFWALAGPRHNGADFAADAFARGASGAVLCRPVAVPAHCWAVMVDDTLQALHRWAALRRSRFGGAVIAVTGSVGKTTARQMIHAALSTRFAGASSPKNYNNHVGLPLSMLQIEPEHEYAVLELGASGPGEIATLAELCRPTIAAITSAGDAHLGGFGSRQAVAEAKAELLAALPPEGHAVLADDPWLRRVAGRSRAPITWVGRGLDCEVTGGDVRWARGRLRFCVSGCQFCVPVWGRHHLNSALIAVAVARKLGLALEEIAAGLEKLDPVPMRCEVTDCGGATLINDAYNASPTAMTAALELLRDMEGPGRRIVVCGDMAELGQESATLHRRLGAQVVTHCGADLLIACGQWAGCVAGGARAAGMPRERVIACGTVEEAAAHLLGTLSPGDIVLVKGSRRMEMERVIRAVEQHFEEHAELQAA